MLSDSAGSIIELCNESAYRQSDASLSLSITGYNFAVRPFLRADTFGQKRTITLLPSALADE